MTKSYTCPERWIQIPEDQNNGTCNLPSGIGGCRKTATFNYGPKYGGYPLNRRSAADFYVDLGNGNDWSQTFKTNMSSTWPPIDPNVAAAIVQSDANNVSQANDGYGFVIGKSSTIDYLYPLSFAGILLFRLINLTNKSLN